MRVGIPLKPFEAADFAVRPVSSESAENHPVVGLSACIHDDSPCIRYGVVARQDSRDLIICKRVRCNLNRYKGDDAAGKSFEQAIGIAVGRQHNPFARHFCRLPFQRPSH